MSFCHIINNKNLFITRNFTLIVIILILTIFGSYRLIEEEDDIESQMPLCPTDDEETASLQGNELLFSDFCLQSRDIILGDVKRSLNDLVTNLFGLFYRSFELLGIDKAQVRQAAALKDNTERQAKLKRPSSDRFLQPKGAFSRSPSEKRRPAVAKQGGFPLFNGIIGAIGAVHNAIASTVMKKLDELSKLFGFDKLVGAVGGTCDMISFYERDIRARFNETKQQLMELDASFEAINLNNLNCVTIKRVLRLKGICGFASHLQNPLFKLIINGVNQAKIIE